MGIDADLALDAVLRHVGPAVARHPLALALRTLVLSEAALLALVGSQAILARTSLKQEYIMSTIAVVVAGRHKNTGHFTGHKI